MSQDFDDIDRALVVAEIERQWSITLAPIGQRSIHQRDSNDLDYIVIGGRKTWHGLPNSVLESIEENGQPGQLVIGTKNGETVSIFHGHLDRFLEHKHQLQARANDTLQFNVRRRCDHLTVNEVPSMALHFLTAISCTQEERERQRAIIKVRKELEKLSDDERKALKLLLKKAG